MASNNDSLSFHYMDFHPYHDGNNPSHTQGSDSQTLNYLIIPGYLNDTKKDLSKRISTWLQKEIFTDQDIVVAIAPGHSPLSQSNFLHELIGELTKGNVKDGRDILVRTRAVPMLSRDQSLHEETIEVTDPSQVKGKVVYIIDEIWTTGAVLQACANQVRKAGASDVKLVAVGKTVYYKNY